MNLTSSKRQGRPPTIDNARDRILDKAESLFAQGGYDSTSLNDLAVSMGLTKAAVYHYFPSKQVIYEAIIVRTLAGLYEAVSAELEGITDHGQALRRFMLTHAAYFEMHYDAFLTMLVGYGSMENVVMIADAQKLRTDHENLLRAILNAGVAEGVFRDIDIATTSRAILSMLNWMARWFKPGGPRSAASYAAEYHDLIAHGLTCQR